MSGLGDLVDDFDAEFDRLLHARDTDEQRRALRSVLETLYSLRAHREGGAAKAAYRSRASSCHDGRMTEGIVQMRGQLIHNVVRQYSPEERPLLPEPATYTGNYTFPGSNLVWLHPTERKDPLPHDVLADPRYPFYASTVASQPVLETLQVAREFLVNDPVLGPL